MATSTPDLKTYTGSCACSSFQYTVSLPLITSVYECNCSICVRKGYKWLFPGEGCSQITKDEGKLAVYEFAGKGIAHYFCSVCGIGVFAMKHASPPGRQRGVNVRTLNEIEIMSIPVAPAFNGAALPPQYEPFVGGLITDTTETSSTIYNGSCHCQSITLSFSTSTPISELPVTECTCNACVRIAPLTPTLPSTNFKVNSTGENLSSYHTSCNKTAEFCCTCGVCILVRERDSGGAKLNLRCFNESVELGNLHVKRIE